MIIRLISYKITLLYRKIVIYSSVEKCFAANFFRSSEAFVERNVVVGGSGSGKPRRENSQHALLFTDIEVRHRPRTVSIRAQFHASLSRLGVLRRCQGAFIKKKKKKLLFSNRL